ncbi:bursicon isoform X1 [Vespula maculifrons]
MYHNKRMLWCHIVITSLVMCILFENTKAIVGIDECQATPVIHFLQYPGCIPKPIPSYACRGRCSSYLQVVTKAPLECMCRPCTSIEEYAIIPQEIAGFAEESPFTTSAHFRRSPGLQ